MPYYGLPKLSNIFTREGGEVTFDASLNGHAAVGEVDPGATHTFKSRKAADLGNFSVRKVDAEFGLCDHSSTKGSRIAEGCIEVNCYKCSQAINILPICEEYDGRSFILSNRQWLQIGSPIIDRATNCIHFKWNDIRNWTIHPRKIPKSKGSGGL